MSTWRPKNLCRRIRTGGVERPVAWIGQKRLQPVCRIILLEWMAMQIIATDLKRFEANPVFHEHSLSAFRALSFEVGSKKLPKPAHQRRQNVQKLITKINIRESERIIRKKIVHGKMSKLIRSHPSRSGRCIRFYAARPSRRSLSSATVTADLQTVSSHTESVESL